MSLWSRVSPSINGLMFIESVVLCMCNVSCVLYFAVPGVKRVHVILYGLGLFVSMYVFPIGIIECLFL